jgi:hypothetical protein
MGRPIQGRRSFQTLIMQRSMDDYRVHTDQLVRWTVLPLHDGKDEETAVYDGRPMDKHRIAITPGTAGDRV